MDPGTQLERVRPAAVGWCRERGREVGYEAGTIAAADALVAGQPVVGQHHRRPGDESEGECRVDRVEGFGLEHRQGAAPVGETGSSNCDVHRVPGQGNRFGPVAGLDRLDDTVLAWIDP